MKKVILFVPLLLFIVLSYFLFKGLYNDPKKLQSALIGKPTPAFVLETVESADQLITQEDLKGEIHLLNVWGTWCPSCVYEHSFLNMLERSGDVPIYGVNYRDERLAAMNWLNKKGDPYRANIYDVDGTLAFNLGVYGAPETYIVDAEGVIRYRYAGPLDMNVWAKEFRPRIDAIRAEAEQGDQS